MAAPQVKVEVVLKTDQAKAELLELVGIIGTSISNAFKKAFSDTGTAKQFAKVVKDISTASKEATKSTDKQAQSIKRLTSEQSKAVQVISRLAAIQKQFNDVRSRAFVEAGRATTAEQKFSTELLRQAQAAGVNIGALNRLAQATGSFTSEEIRLKNSVAQLKAEFSTIVNNFNQVSGAEQKLISITRRLNREQQKLAKTQNQLSKTTRDVSTSASQADRFFTPLQSSLAKINNVAAAARNILRFLDITLGELYRTARQGAVINQTAESFARFSKDIIGIPDLLEKLEKAARGTISAFDLQSEALTLISGLTPDVARTFSEALIGAGGFETSLIDVARAAQILNPSLGDVDFFLKSLSIGIKRNERRWIDNLGIVISARESYARFAEQADKDVDALTAVDKQLAVLNETLRVGQLLIEQTGGEVDNQVDSFKRLETTVENFKNGLKGAISEAVLPFIDALVNLNGEAFLDVAEGAREAANAIKELGGGGNVFAPIREGFDELVDEIKSRALEIDELPFVSFEAANAKAISESQKAFEELVLAIGDVAPTTSIAVDEIQKLLSLLSQEFDIQIQPDVFAPVIIPVLAELATDEQDFTDQVLELFDPVTIEKQFGDVFAEFEIPDFEIDPVFGEIPLETTERLRLFFEEFSRIKEQQLALDLSSDFLTLGDEIRIAGEKARQAEENFRKIAVALDEIADEFLPKQIELVRELGEALEELDKIEAAEKLAESFKDQFLAEIAKTSVATNKFLTDIEVGFGSITRETADTIVAAKDLNDEINELAKLLEREGVSSAEVTANAFLLLSTGLAASAEEALNLARNQEFVTNTLGPAVAAIEAEKEAAIADAEALEELADSTEAVTEATKELKDTLSDIVVNGFDKARSAISKLREAQRGIVENQGEFGTVLIDNTAKIAKIDEQLFTDLGDERKKELLEQLKGLREGGEEFSAEYANILRDLNEDLSQAERDELLLERFELSEQQGDIVSGIFGRDKEALEKFSEEAQAAIQELVEIRRQTVVDLFAEGRAIAFETEVALLLNFELIDDLEAELLLKERQFFDIIDTIFGSGTIFEVEGEIIDFGKLLLKDLGADQIADLVNQIEASVAAGLGAQTGLAAEVAINLVLTGDIDISQLGGVLTGAFQQIEEGATAEQAVAITLTPSFENVDEVEKARELIERLAETGEEVPINIKADIEKFDQILEKATGINEQITELEEMGEVEVVVVADIDEAQTVIDNFINKERTLVIEAEVNIEEPRISTEGTPPTTPPPPPIRGGLQQFRHGGFTGTGSRDQVAGVVEFQEFVFNATDTARIGLGNLDALQNGDAFIFGEQTTSLPQDILSTMISALRPESPTLLPAPINNNQTSTRNISTDNSTNIVNNFFDRPSRDVATSPDYYG